MAQDASGESGPDSAAEPPPFETGYDPTTGIYRLGPLPGLPEPPPAPAPLPPLNGYAPAAPLSGQIPSATTSGQIPVTPLSGQIPVVEPEAVYSDHTGTLYRVQATDDQPAESQDLYRPGSRSAARRAERSLLEAAQEEPVETPRPLAVVTAALAAIGAVPLALIGALSTVILVRRRGGTGLGAAATTFVVCATWVGLTGLAIAMMNRPVSALRPISQQVTAPVTALEPGDCLKGTPRAGLVTLAPCDSPHSAQVISRLTLVDGPWQGLVSDEETALSTALATCEQDAVGTLAPPIQVPLKHFIITAEPRQIAQGSNRAICLVGPASGELFAPLATS